MYCPKCNADVTGTESACPVCGVPFIHPTTPPTALNGAKMINPDSVAQAVQSVTIIRSEPKKATSTSNKKEKKKIPPVILITIILFIGLGILYFLAFANFKPNSDSNKKINKTIINDTKTKKYGGYIFDIPDDYKVKKTSDGLEFKGQELYFIIGIDYTNNLELYMNSYCSKYNLPVEKAKKLYGYKEYLLFNTRENSTNGSIYVTSGKNDEIFVGIIIRKDNKVVQEEDIDTVFKVINTATSSDKKTKEDLGKFGIKIYHITPVFME